MQGKWGPIKYIVKISTNGSIQDIIIISLVEKTGQKIRNKTFLNQFSGKSYNELNNIDTISGATISSRALILGIKRVLSIFIESEKNQK